MVFAIHCVATAVVAQCYLAASAVQQFFQIGVIADNFEMDGARAVIHGAGNAQHILAVHHAAHGWQMVGQRIHVHVQRVEGDIAGMLSGANIGGVLENDHAVVVLDPVVAVF